MNENNVNKNTFVKKLKSLSVLFLYESLIAFVVVWGVLNKSNIVILLNIYLPFLVISGCVLLIAMSLGDVNFKLKYANSVLAIPFWSIAISSVLRLAESLFLAHNNYVFLSVTFFMTFGLQIANRRASKDILSQIGKDN